MRLLTCHHCTSHRHPAQIRLPTTQSTLNYVLLTGYIAHRWYQQGRLRLAVRWWVYALLAIADVEANYLVVKAYQYTSITSIMLIDCFTIPCVMVLSKAVLRASVSEWHRGRRPS